jgi:hypothetical protein
MSELISTPFRNFSPEPKINRFSVRTLKSVDFSVRGEAAQTLDPIDLVSIGLVEAHFDEAA